MRVPGYRRARERDPGASAGRGGAVPGRGRRPMAARRAAAAAAMTARSPTGWASRCAPTWRAAFDRMAAAARREAVCRCRSPAPFAPTPSRRGCSPPTRTRSGSPRRARACTATPPSSTSARPPPTAGWRPTPAASASSTATRGSPGTSASAPTRATAQHPAQYEQRLVGAARRRPRPGPARLPELRPAALPRSDRAGGAALERADEPAGRAALRRVGLQPVRHPARPAPRGSRSSCRARPRATASRNPFDPAAAIDAQAHLMQRPAARSSPASSRWRWPPTTPGPAAVARYGGIPPYPETRPTWRRSSACWAAPGT